MINEIPVISLFLGTIFIICFIMESRLDVKGIIVGIGSLINLMAILFMFINGIELNVILLFVIVQLIICAISLEKEKGYDENITIGDKEDVI